MPRPALATEQLAVLRVRAASRLSPGPGPNGRAGGSGSGSEALAVLHALASSPDTATDALALLHELQVHQVELELQAEELRESRAELEAALQQQIDLHDKQPVGCLSIDPRGALTDLNLTGATMLGVQRGQALGQPVDSLFSPGSAHALQAWFAAAGSREASGVLTLHLASPQGDGRALTALVRSDPADQRCRVVLVELPTGSAASPAAAPR